ncbi:MAG TPA: hypothetical protein VG028_03505 [Terriglobia bacterium]|nr:hypothetical protein [Terriglobia bacterium]
MPISLLSAGAIQLGTIYTRITRLSDLWAAVAKGDVVVISPPVSVTLSIVPQTLYENGTPFFVSFP